MGIIIFTASILSAIVIIILIGIKKLFDKEI